MRKLHKEISLSNIFLALFFINFVVLFINIILGNDNVNANVFNAWNEICHMDFFDSLWFAIQKNPYDFSDMGAIYPPFCYMVLNVISRLIPNSEQFVSPYELRETQYSKQIFLSYIVICTAVIVVFLYKLAEKHNIKPWLLISFFLLSAPYLALNDRGNLLITALAFVFIFLFYYDSQSKKDVNVAIVALSIAAAIKIYPAILGMLLIKKGNLRNVLKAIIVGALVFLLPCLYFDGFSTLKMFLSSIMGGVEVTPVNLEAINGRVDFSTVLATAFRFVFNRRNLPVNLIAIISRYGSYVLTILFVYGSFVFKEKHKTILCLCAVTVILPAFGYIYGVAMYMPAICYFICVKSKKAFDYLYLLPFLMISSLVSLDFSGLFMSLLNLEIVKTVPIVTNVGQLILVIVLSFDILINTVRGIERTKV